MTISFLVRWPFRYDPLSNLVTPMGQWWVAAWLMVGPLLFTGYLLWRRIGTTNQNVAEGLVAQAAHTRQ